MFQPLSQYLFQYGQVSIPRIGRFELVRQPAVLQVAEKLVQPPSWSARFAPLSGAPSDAVTEHQLVLLAGRLHTNTASASQMLDDFGRRLEKSLLQEPFHWNGVGRLESSGTGILFYPEDMLLEGWQPVAAERVIRENVRHAVLVGDRELYSGGVKEVERPQAKKPLPYLAIAAWILVFLCVLYLIFYFSHKGFEPAATGNKIKFEVEAPGPSYKKQ